VELIVFLVLGLIGMALVLAWSIGLGWLLTRLLPFSLFEGSLLAMAASVVVGYLATRLMSAIDLPFTELEDADDDMAPSRYDIPATRFYAAPSDRTWAAWFTYELANRLADALEQSPRVAGRLDKAQRQELAIRLAAIRLAEVAVALLRTKTGRAKHIRTRLVDWQQHMAKQDMKPYDEAILKLAMLTLHGMLTLPVVERVVRAKLWDRPAPDLDLP
jgi:hypothetical protein